MKIALQDITDIQIGYQHRDRKEKKARPINMSSAGSHRIIQIKDLDIEGRFKKVVIEQGGLYPYVWPGSLYAVTPLGNPEPYLVGRGDVLFLSKGQSNFAIPILEDLERTVASYYFYILRPDRAQILPEYLAWYINQPKAQASLGKDLRQSVIKMIPKRVLAQLEIVVPPMEKQKALIHLERLRQREEYLMSRIVEERKRLIDAFAIQAVSEYRLNQ
jgi:restriction endonuclease S subunit